MHTHTIHKRTPVHLEEAATAALHVQVSRQACAPSQSCACMYVCINACIHKHMYACLDTNIYTYT